jgi:hypothetical protein
MAPGLPRKGRPGRWVQALIPIVATPLVFFAINHMGSDKAVLLIIPWLAFGAVYAVLFLVLSRHLAATVVLTTATFLASVVGAYAITFAVLSYLTWRAGA